MIYGSGVEDGALQLESHVGLAGPDISHARKVTKHPKKFRFALRAKGRVNLRFYCAARAQRRGTREGQQQRESSVIWLAFLTLRFEAGAPSNI